MTVDTQTLKQVKIRLCNCKRWLRKDLEALLERTEKTGTLDLREEIKDFKAILEEAEDYMQGIELLLDVRLDELSDEERTELTRFSGWDRKTIQKEGRQ